MAAALILSCACAGPQRRPIEDPGARAAYEASRGCKPLFALDRDEAPRHSCWHRLWEVPAALVAYPVIAGAAIAVITSPIWAPILIAKKR